ncbi:arsenate reductase/protein-tyrosine-phosphatase family protein [Paraburkholderia solisilvae]|uniref:protein-tyrosine-phosphatase n=1 Tax=Paraburkholderia solisilvae TaxID=624376 RepID=A0A6J5ETD0_9BURK|nr:low molecular weight phosphotyrosine protein phosphatase [Paraburkholderia solisilvae]CAB3768466.1 Low molecular weight protein-tyrosine-phosphatase Ptp [Paraburkholderia solisilvae]
MFSNVLIVCHANVCRSPAAEMLFKARRSGHPGAPIAFHSAGIRAVDGDGMDPVMRRLLEERGVTAGEHHARRLNKRMVRDADLVLVTEQRQVKDVEALDPAARGKVHALGKWEGADVVDPHGGEERHYRESLVLIEHLVMGWLNKIC